MARLCDKCLNYSADIDEFRQMYVDTIVIDGNELEQHFCPMYDDHIPFGIYYNNDACPFFRQEQQKGETEDARM